MEMSPTLLTISLHQRGAFYSLVGKRCVTPSVLILELTGVLYKNNKKILKRTCLLKLNLNYLELHIYIKQHKLDKLKP